MTDVELGVTSGAAVDLAPQRPGRLVLRSPVLAAAGSVGYGLELMTPPDPGHLGALVTRGTTLKARSGAPAPRTAEVPGGLLHAIGLPNQGIDAVLKRFAPRWAALAVPVILSVAAIDPDDFETLARRTDGVPGVAALELDLASIDLARGARPLSMDPFVAGRAVAAARAATELPLLAKLTLAVTGWRSLAHAVAAAGADAITCGGGPPALALDPATGQSRLGSPMGVLSGPALRPLAVRAVSEVSQYVTIPVVGCGGVTTAEDAAEILAAGAAAVAVGLAALADPASLLWLASLWHSGEGRQCADSGSTDLTTASRPQT